jgi:chloramphenicol 3-O phosphotransferase
MIIIINGAPSAGKTSIIKEMQKIYPQPLLRTGIDHFWATIPDQYKEFGAQADQGYHFIQSTDKDGNPVAQAQSGPLGKKIDNTIAQVVKCLADCGHDVAVDEILWEKRELQNYRKALKNHSVYFIGVICDLQELERREKARGNREIGLARGHIDIVHQHKDYYDLVIDSTNCDAATCAQNILDFIKQTPHPQGLKKLEDVL